ncbi:hypothetical protein LC593_24985 [Nostoc sp. CHAB 5844]|nr:hypothetical protein [Nostoc sp. CHAB 5844]
MRNETQHPKTLLLLGFTAFNLQAQNNVKSLLNYRQLALYVLDNHPREEHLLPLLVALEASVKMPEVSNSIAVILTACSA